TYAYSNSCSPCTLPDSFCPYGAVEEISYSTFESIEQDQDYLESPENTVFDDILMQNIFSFNAQSDHCVLVSPITCVLLVIALGTRSIRRETIRRGQFVADNSSHRQFVVGQFFAWIIGRNVN
ncbi:unnamed protein product, partial [Rotaria magnacalcarata]